MKSKVLTKTTECLTNAGNNYVVQKFYNKTINKINEIRVKYTKHQSGGMPPLKIAWEILL